jgi:hypothetical protein
LVTNGETAAGHLEPRLVPVYALTRGRTRSGGHDLPWEAMVSSTDAGVDALPELRFEQARIVELCRRPVSVAEVAVELHVPLGVARVLVSDLNSGGMLAVHRADVDADGRPSTEVLERLLAGLRASTNGTNGPSSSGGPNSATGSNDTSDSNGPT